jgi:hypothetical protein
MADFQRQRFEALTLDDWRALDPTGNKQGPTRPVTDAAIGGMTDSRRKAGAECSAMFDEAGIAQPGWTKPTTTRRPHGALPARGEQVSTDHLHTPEVRAKRTASRQANQAATRPTTRPGSETTNLRPGNPIRVRRTGDSSAHNGRTGWVAVVNTQEFPDGRLYTEIGVTWAITRDWARAAADTWFRVDELDAQ